MKTGKRFKFDEWNYPFVADMEYSVSELCKRQSNNYAIYNSTIRTDIM